MAKSDSREERSSKKSKRKSLFSVRNGVILLIAIGFLVVGGKMMGLFGKPAAIENAAVQNTAVTETQQTSGGQQNPMQAMHAKSSGAHVMTGRTAADLMDKKFVALEETLTAGQAVERLKEKEISAENPLPVYVVDSLGRLVGKSAPDKVLVASEDTPLKEIMVPNVEAAEINSDAAWVAERMQASGAAVMPVVDMAGRLVGLVPAERLKARAASEAPAERQAPEAEAHAAHAQTPAQSSAGETVQLAEKTEAEAPAAAHGQEGEAGKAATGKHAVQAGEKVAVAHEKTHAAGPAEGNAGQKTGEAAEAPKAKGVAFVEAMVKPLKHELEDRFWGWRPNDILDFTDNVNQFQLGVLEVTRRTAVALAGRISRTGTIESFDPNVQNAMNWFMVKSTRYWLPSPEYKYRAGIKELEKYKERLQRGEATFYTRQDNLIPLLVAYKDLLGSCEENLVKSKEEDGSSVSFFKADDYFYYAQGVASAMHTILEAVAEDFRITVESRRGMQELEHAIHWCHIATEIHPWLILDSSSGSIFANHRANLAAPISHARFHLGVLIKTLST